MPGIEKRTFRGTTQEGKAWPPKGLAPGRSGPPEARPPGGLAPPEGSPHVENGVRGLSDRLSLSSCTSPPAYGEQAFLCLFFILRGNLVRHLIVHPERLCLW